jgi:vitellogenic carboxypeptidase-like protein
MYAWYFPSQDGNANAPLLIWLQGGPGGSSMFGLFVENGPFSVDQNLNVVARDFSWNLHYSMLFIDNPVGAGFSYTQVDAGYCTNQLQVSANLLSLLTQFYAVFPETVPCDLYITGESYAG